MDEKRKIRLPEGYQNGTPVSRPNAQGGGRAPQPGAQPPFDDAQPLDALLDLVDTASPTARSAPHHPASDTLSAADPVLTDLLANLQPPSPQVSSPLPDDSFGDAFFGQAQPARPAQPQTARRSAAMPGTQPPSGANVPAGLPRTQMPQAPSTQQPLSPNTGLPRTQPRQPQPQTVSVPQNTANQTVSRQQPQQSATSPAAQRPIPSAAPMQAATLPHTAQPSAQQTEESFIQGRPRRPYVPPAPLPRSAASTRPPAQPYEILEIDVPVRTPQSVAPQAMQQDQAAPPRAKHRYDARSDEGRNASGGKRYKGRRPARSEPHTGEPFSEPYEDTYNTSYADPYAAEDTDPDATVPFSASEQPSDPSARKPSRKEKKPKKKHRFLRRLFACFLLLALCECGGLWIYCEVATQNDFLWLDLAQLPHRDATVLYAQGADGAWQEYARLEATQQKQWVPLSEIPKNLQHAFVAIEDKNFYKHHGVSWTRTIFAVLNEVKRTLTGTYFGGENGIKQGASTIHQQLIKNLTTDDNATGIKGYLRKVREIYRAYQMNSAYDKDTILEAYLNVISFTGNTAGVQAESYKLFGVPVGELTLEQCASIAAITKNPYRYDPTRNPDTHLSRRNYILYEMAEQGYITQAEYEQASANPIGLSAGNLDMPKTAVTSYFTDQVITEVSAQLADAYSLTRKETTYLLYNGGLRIYTTVDPTLQSAMEQTMTSGGLFPQRGLGVATKRAVYDDNGKKVVDEAGNVVYEDITEYPQAAMVSLGYDGALKAVVGGLGEKEISRGFNRGTDAVRQVGSTMKPIGAYALGIESNRVTWSTPFLDTPVRKIEDEATGELRDWPANVTKTYSEKDILVADALAQSVNTIAVRVGEKAGIGNIYRFQKKIGITSFTPKDKAAGPMVLGSSTYGVTPYELAGAYLMFGNGGSYTTPHSYTSVQTGYGQILLEPKLQTRSVLSADTAYVMNRMLKGVMTGYGSASGYSVRGEMESVGKTGTTSDNRDYWFVGLTPYYVTATWYGYDSGFALNTAQGTHAPTGAWKTVMEQAQRGLPALQFPTDATVVTATYCKESGGLASAACPGTAEGYYRVQAQPAPCRLHAA